MNRFIAKPWPGILSPLLAAALLLGLSGAPATAQQNQGFMVTNTTAGAYQQVPTFENQLYGHTYPNQSIAQRLGRIERTLFGNKQHGSLEVRMQHITARMQERNSQEALAEQEPLIEYLEEKLFQRTHNDKSLPERMHLLEMQVFGRSYDEYPLAVRVKKLSYAMPIMAKEIRLSRNSDDMVIATTRRTSQRPPHSNRPVDVIQLDATASTTPPLPRGAMPNTGDYFQSVHRNTNGTWLRWDNLPIKVYVKQNGLEAALTLQAIKAWQSSFSVVPTQNPMQADVIVSWDQRDWQQNAAGTLTRPVTHMDANRRIRTVMLVTLFPAKAVSNELKLHAVSHQLGHAFGLWAHSDDPADLMYPVLRLEMNDYPAKWSWRSASAMSRIQPTGQSEGYAPSQRDINTLLKVYDQPASDLSLYSPY